MIWPFKQKNFDPVPEPIEVRILRARVAELEGQLGEAHHRLALAITEVSRLNGGNVQFVSVYPRSLDNLERNLRRACTE